MKVDLKDNLIKYNVKELSKSAINRLSNRQQCWYKLNDDAWSFKSIESSKFEKIIPWIEVIQNQIQNINLFVLGYDTDGVGTVCFFWSGKKDMKWANIMDDF